MTDRAACTADRHGDAVAYQRHGCRCDDARNAQRLYRKRLAWRHHTGVATKVPGWRVHRRMQALMAIGWSRKELFLRLGYAPTGTWLVMNQAYTPDVLARVDALYRELCMTPGPSKWTRTWATSRGFAPPLAWDDIDNPDEWPHGIEGQARPHPESVDPAVIDRVLSGEWRLPTTTAERRIIAARYVEEDRGTTYRLSRLTGWKVERYYRIEKEAS